MAVIRCRVCNRVLKSTESQMLGIGPVCRGTCQKSTQFRRIVENWEKIDDERQLKLDFANDDNSPTDN